ncbi:hypothetical protein ID866_12845, partial [Astraeus odoratus]
QTFESSYERLIIAASSSNDAENTITIWKKVEAESQTGWQNMTWSFWTIFYLICVILQFLSQVGTIFIIVRLLYEM